MELIILLLMAGALSILMIPILKKEKLRPWTLGAIFISSGIIAFNSTYRTCKDGWLSHSIGKQGACSWHGGVVSRLTDIGWIALITSLVIIALAYIYIAYKEKSEERKRIVVPTRIILKNLNEIFDDAIGMLEKDGYFMTSHEKAIFRFECTAYIYWLIYKANAFSVDVQFKFLAEVPRQYGKCMSSQLSSYRKIRKNLESRFLSYSKTCDNEDEFLSKSTIIFTRILNHKLSSELDSPIDVPILLIKKIVPRFEEWNEILLLKGSSTE